MAPHSPCSIGTQLMNEITKIVAPLVDKARERRPKPRTPSSTEGMIVLPSGDVSITSAAETLFQRIAPSHELFNRGGVCMRMIEDESGSVRLETMRPAAFRSFLEKYGDPCAWRIGRTGDPVLQRVLPSVDIADALLQSEPAAKILPRVRALVNCPVIAKTAAGPAVLAKGYHAHEGGLIVTGGAKPEEMTVEKAVALIRELGTDFQFQTPGDEARALAAYITPALTHGGWIAGNIPANVAEADDSQSGKGYMQKLIAAVYRDAPRTISKRDGGVGGIDESVQSALVAGSPFISLDNLRGQFNSQWIEMLLTAGGCVPCRIPHRGDIMVDVRHVILMLTSNGVETTKDFANRSSIVRIRKREPGYVFLHYPEGDILSHVRANQPKYLGAVFAIVRAWHAAGCPKSNHAGHDFREWARTLGWIVENILHTAPLMEGHAEAQIRVSNPSLVFVRAVAIALAQDDALGQTVHAAELGEICDQHAIEIPGVRPSANETERAKAIGRTLKRAFGQVEKIEVDGFIISRSESQKYYEASQEWKMVKSYVFVKNTPQPEQPEEPEQPSRASRKLYNILESNTPYSGYSGNREESEDETTAQPAAERDFDPALDLFDDLAEVEE